MPNLELLNPSPVSPPPERPPDGGEPQPAVYGEFYEKYGALAVSSMPGLAGSRPLLDARVLHFDSPHDRAVHLFLYVPKVLGIKYSLPRTDTSGNAYRYYAYEPEGTVAFVTDGQATQAWVASDINGTHRGAVNAIDKPYRPGNETLHIRFGDYLRPHVRVYVAGNGEAGTVHFGSGLMAWILDEPTSARERERALATVGV